MLPLRDAISEMLPLRDAISEMLPLRDACEEEETDGGGVTPASAAESGESSGGEAVGGAKAVGGASGEALGILLAAERRAASEVEEAGEGLIPEREEGGEGTGCRCLER